MKTIKGQKITELRAIQRYNNNCIGVFDDSGNYFLMKVTEIMKFDTDFNDVTFKLVKKKVHTYLEVVQK